MPTCPGCHESIPYRRLPVHQRYCPGIWTTDSRFDPRTRAVEQVAQNLRVQERRLEARIDRLERSLSELRGKPESPSNPDR